MYIITYDLERSTLVFRVRLVQLDVDALQILLADARMLGTAMLLKVREAMVFSRYNSCVAGVRLLLESIACWRHGVTQASRAEPLATWTPGFPLSSTEALHGIKELAGLQR